MLEKPDKGTSKGQLVALHAGAKGLLMQTWPCMLCVPAVYNQQIHFCGVGLFLLSEPAPHAFQICGK